MPATKTVKTLVNMSAIKKVAVVGASGNLGVPVIAALLESGFVVTAITRQESTATPPAGVIVKRADLNSLDSLTEAFQGQDAIVSTVATAAVNSEKTIIDAAIAARIKRFIPSEFGANTREARGTKLGSFLNAKIQNVDYLIQLEKKYKWFTWTALSTGSFFDWSFRVGIIGFDLQNKTARIFDSGNELYSPSNLPFIGKCVAGVLTHPNGTANKYLTVASFTTTQNEILRILEEEMGTKFQISSVRTKDLEKIGDEKMASKDPNAYVEYAVQWMFGDGAGHPIKDNAASLLGLAEEDVRESIKKVLSEL